MNALPPRLTVLVLRGNQLSDLPDDWSPLAKTLRTLNVSKNRLSKLQPTFARLQKLRILNLENNALGDAHGLDVLNNLPLLEEVYLGHNRLTSLPEDFLAYCHELHRLELNGNLLRSIPVALTTLRSLKYLNVSQNDLSALPMRKFGGETNVTCFNNPGISWLPLHLVNFNGLRSNEDFSHLPTVAFDCRDCFQTDGKGRDKEDVSFIANLNDGKTLNFALNVSEVNQAATNLDDPSDVPLPLREQCLRTIYYCKVLNRDQLPKAFKEELQDGPRIFCDYCNRGAFRHWRLAVGAAKVKQYVLEWRTCQSQHDRVYPTIPLLAVFCMGRCLREARMGKDLLEKALALNSVTSVNQLKL